MVVAGTRPELIKLAPVMKSLNELGVDYTFVWSGQHYDYRLSRIFLEQLALPNPDENLGVGSGTHAEQTARLMMALEKVIERRKPEVVIAEGDTNTVLAAAMTSTKMGIPFAHVEAGLRSWDRTMPEEINRVVADSLAVMNFAPTELAVVNLTHEGVDLSRIELVGNTIVDVLMENLPKVEELKSEILGGLDLEENKFLLVTVHRQENTDDRARLESIISALRELSKEVPVVFPIHPRTASRIREYGTSLEGIRVVEPLGYLQFLSLLSACLAVLTDSGGVQEEAFTLGVPAVTLRYNTERPETVRLGGNFLVGTNREDIVKRTKYVIERRDEISKKIRRTVNPFGDGRSGERIAKILASRKFEIRSSDTRADPYVTYALRRNAVGEEVLSMYNSEGMATASRSLAKFVTVRCPVSMLRSESGSTK